MLTKILQSGNTMLEDTTQPSVSVQEATATNFRGCYGLIYLHWQEHVRTGILEISKSPVKLD